MKDFLSDLHVDRDIIESVVDIALNSSWSKNKNVPADEQKNYPLCKRAVMDADKLDAYGAIGISRCFACASEMGNVFYEIDKETGKQNPKSAYAHLQEKILKLPDYMLTDVGRHEMSCMQPLIDKFMKQLVRDCDRTTSLETSYHKLLFSDEDAEKNCDRAKALEYAKSPQNIAKHGFVIRAIDEFEY